jgi:hypothetical protein
MLCFSCSAFLGFSWLYLALLLGQVAWLCAARTPRASAPLSAKVRAEADNFIFIFLGGGGQSFLRCHSTDMLN